MIAKHANGEWTGIEPESYKDEPGTWVGVSRRTLLSSPGMGFEVRYFELAPGGYTSFEKHTHEHAVMVREGQGRVRLGDAWTELAANDLVHVLSGTPHQFQNTGDTPFGIVCIVDRERDKPVILESDMEAHAR